MTLYILSSVCIPVHEDALRRGVFISERVVDLETARRIVNCGHYISAVDHESTARILSRLLGVEIPFNRITVALYPSDSALCFIPKQELLEERILSEKELTQLDYMFIYAFVYHREWVEVI